MKKDSVIWCVCALLFLAGGVYFNILPQLSVKKEFSNADLIGAFSAIASALAAYASWRSAKISAQSAEDSKKFTNVQLYIEHRKGFLDLLDYLSVELNIVFVRRYELYRRLFPENHYAGNSFSVSGNSLVFDSWAEKYRAIVDSAKPDLADHELDTWIMCCCSLFEDVQFEMGKSEEPQIFLWGKTPAEAIHTGFTHDPARQVFYIAEVINRLLSFCDRENIKPLLMDGHEFQKRFMQYFFKINGGSTDHRIGVPGKAS